MIAITINKEKKGIYSADELPAKHYIEMLQKGFGIVNYISVCTGESFKKAAGAKYRNYGKLLKRIGKIQDHSKMTPNKKIIIGGKVLDVASLEISTVGQRWMIEENTKGMDEGNLIVYILAVAIADDYMNSDEVDKIRGQLLEIPYKQVMPAAFFLLRRFLIGKRNAMSYFRMLSQLINMKVSGPKLALQNWDPTLIITKYKRFVTY